MSVNAHNTIESFLEMMSAERGASKNTLDAYARDLVLWNENLSLKSGGLLNARPEDLERVLALWAKDGLAASTSARKLSALKQYYIFLQTDDLCEDNPAH